MPALIDLTGRRFHRWTVLHAAPTARNGKRYWVCRCDCGTEKIVPGGGLRCGDSKSCGCWNRDSARARETTHGLTRHPLYAIWRGMSTRCENPNRKSYADYGGRGIKVCDRWGVFENFFADMSPTWKPGLTIERIDNDQGYEPGNCTWVPRARQSRNRRICIYLQTPWGELTLAEAARNVGISRRAMKARVDRAWAPERLFAAKLA